MITVEHKPTVGQKLAHVVARIVLANGTIAGEGYACEPVNAIYFACVDARDAGFSDAAAGHAREALGTYPDDIGLQRIADRMVLRWTRDAGEVWVPSC